AAPAIVFPVPEADALLNGQIATQEQLQQILEISGVFKGHELTRKDGRIASGIAPLDALIGGLPRGRISEVIGPVSSGKTTIAAAFASAASRRGEVIGWVDVPGAFDPRSLEVAGVDPARILWVSFDKKASSRTFMNKERERRIELKAAELLLEAGGFGLVIIDFGAMRYPLSQSASIRLAHAAERSGVAVLALATSRVCGTFAALTLSMSKHRASFTRMSLDAPMLFEGLRLEASVERNKLGVFGDRSLLFAAIDPLSCDLTRRSSAGLSLKGEGQKKETASEEIISGSPSLKGKGLGVRSPLSFPETPLPRLSLRNRTLGEVDADHAQHDPHRVRDASTTNPLVPLPLLQGKGLGVRSAQQIASRSSLDSAASLGMTEKKAGRG
ncbi:MAG TPA: hypothetical protein VMT64_02130, partial [Candidatus Binataceae bacterium]|nr:hypothetical protein [Candidatus Binataceae bacterium]